MSKRKILLLAGNYYPEPTGIGRYNAEMTDWLADNGFDCTVISTYPYYPYWKIQPPYTKKKWWFTKEIKTTKNNNCISVYRCPHYIPQNPTGKKRIFLDLTFFLSAALRIISFPGRKFDYVINVTPPLPLGLAAVAFKKISGANFLYHIQDLQVDAARELNMISSEKLIKVLFKTEKFILKYADKISTISKGMQQKVSAKTNKKIYLFPNWTDINIFYPLNDKEILKSQFGFKTDIPVILYSGAIGEKQGLENILQAAYHLQHTNTAVQFVICGSGPYKSVLAEKAASLKLSNITFLPLQPNEKLNAFLNMADIHLVIQKAGASDLVMPSKLTNILSVGGVAIVTADKGSLYDTVKAFNIGLLCPPENEKALINTINQALTINHDNIRMNACNYAQEHLSIEKIMSRYVKEVIGI